MIIKLFIRTFPSAEECELFQSILQSKWPSLLQKAPGCRLRLFVNKQTPHTLNAIWEFPDEPSQKIIEKLIDENITKYARSLSPITMTVSGEVIWELSDKTNS